MKKIILCLFLSITATWALPVLKPTEDQMYRVDGKPWTSNDLKGKVQVVFYVDPDEKELNVHVEKALNKQNFPKDKFATTAIINMEATWVPNMILNGLLEDKQEEYPDTVYIKDFDSTMVKSWGMADDAYDIMVLDSKGIKLVHYKGAELNKKQVKELIRTIKRSLKK